MVGEESASFGARTWLLNNFLRAAGIAGLTITLLGNVDTYISAMKWAHYIVEQWNVLAKTIWSNIFWFFPRVSSLDANILTLSAILVASAIRSSFSKRGYSNKIVHSSLLLIGVIIIFYTFSSKIQAAFVDDEEKMQYSAAIERKYGCDYLRKKHRKELHWRDHLDNAPPALGYYYYDETICENDSKSIARINAKSDLLMFITN